MDRNVIAIALVLTLLILTVGCTYPPPSPPLTPEPVPSPEPTPAPAPAPFPTPQADDSGVTSEGVQSVADANNQFAIDFYSKLQSEQQYGAENIFFSPYSMSSAFAMVYEGAKEQTADEIRSVFGFPEEDSARRASMAGLYNRLNKPDAPYELRTANALWIQKNYALLPDYLNTVEKYYGGKATNVDFVGATEETRQAINAWVEEKTNNKIKDLFPSGSLDPTGRLVLTNAVYFKGKWLEQFDPEQTKEEDFWVSAQQSVRALMMHNTAHFSYAETEDLQILEMPYQGENVSMLVLLSKDKEGLRALEESLSAEKLEEWREQVQRQEVVVYFPKFKLERKYYPTETLSEMGMPSAFKAGGANLSGMDGTIYLFIQTVVHQAFVEVNEEGTEAAAATGIAMGIESLPPPPPVFRADHPFIFIIQEKETGAILFMGRVADPTK